MSSASQKKLRQMLEMLIILSSTPWGREKKSLAEHFNIDIRTVERYIKTFKEVGFVVENPKAGFCKINKELSDYKDLSELLHFSEEESYILRSAIESIDVNTEIKEQLWRKLYSIYNFDRVATPLQKTRRTMIIEELTQAITNHKMVNLINYRSANSMIESTRTVEPFDFTHNYTALWAYEPNSNICKTFNISRIGKIKILDTGFELNEKHKKRKTDIFRMSGEEATKVELRLTLRAFNLLIEEFPLSEKEIVKDDDKTYILKTQIYNTKGIIRFIMGLPEDIEIIEPNSLKNEIHERLEKFLKKISL